MHGFYTEEVEYDKNDVPQKVPTPYGNGLLKTREALT